MTGETISHYRVIRPLASGGMGVVYEAEDLSLGRRVALKSLPPEFARDEVRRLRFAREASALAALNHPNIVTVYAVEEAEGRHYLAMELVEGRTLLAHLSRSGLPLSETLKLGAQIADALAAAHQRGITHRDIKPANIMVTPEGRVKVLDFGLAKPIAGKHDESQTTLAVGGPATGEGHIVGTVAYMSPEQAQGMALDSRSDIFSLGVVLYEMATGVRPFKGDTNVALIASIVKDTPKLACDVSARVPVELARVIRRCLKKDPDHRYQSAKDLRNELAELTEESASGELPSERAAKQRRQPKRRALLVAVLAATAVLALAAMLAWSHRLPFPGAGGADRERDALGDVGIPAQVTAAPGWEAQPALSPDGSLVAYTSNESGNSDIWVIGFRGGAAVRLTTDPATDERPAWLPDGSGIVFASDRGGSWGLWQVAALGGNVSLLVPDARDPAISPHGDRIAFTRTEGGSVRLFVAPLSRPMAAKRVVSGVNAMLMPEEDPAWSPDGKQLAYSADRGLWCVWADGGQPIQLTRDREYDIEPAWSADGQSLYFASHRGGVFALWEVSASGEGAPRRVTRGAGQERQPSVSQGGRRLAFSSFAENMDLLLCDLSTGRQVRTGTTRDEMSPAFSRDGRSVVYVADAGRRGGTEVWIQALVDGSPDGSPRLLTDLPGALSHPEFSPDGRWVVIQRVDGGLRDIWIVPTKGGEPLRFTDDPADDFNPAWSPTGTLIAFVSTRRGTPQVWVAQVADGRPAGAARLVAGEPGGQSQPAWSPDGKRIAFLADSTTGSEVWTAAVDSASKAKRVTTDAGAGFVRWDPRGRSLLVSGSWGGATLSIRRVDPDTGESRPLQGAPRLEHPSARPMFDISRDGRMLAISQGSWAGDIWAAEIVSTRR